MSREFGDDCGSFFHEKIRNAVNNCKYEGNYELTKKWGEFLQEFYNIAYSISSCEASDTCESDLIMDTIYRLPLLQGKLDEIQQYVQLHKTIANHAVRDYINKEKKDGC